MCFDGHPFYDEDTAMDGRGHTAVDQAAAGGREDWPGRAARRSAALSL